MAEEEKAAAAAAASEEEEAMEEEERRDRVPVPPSPDGAESVRSDTAVAGTPPPPITDFARLRSALEDGNHALTAWESAKGPQGREAVSSAWNSASALPASPSRKTLLAIERQGRGRITCSIIHANHEASMTHYQYEP